MPPTEVPPSAGNRVMAGSPPVASVCGIILAGGRSSRMNPAGAPPHSKARIELAGEPLLAHVVSRLRPQVATLLISANRELDWFRRFAAPVVVDLLPDHP